MIHHGNNWQPQFFLLLSSDIQHIQRVKNLFQGEKKSKLREEISAHLDPCNIT